VTEIVDRQEFLSGLEDSELLSAEEIQRAAEAAAGAGMDGAALGSWLVDQGILTPYQVRAITGRRLGDLRIGNYDVLDRVGAGGMGTVFKARHARMKRIVALKLMSRKLAEEDDTFVRRFQREVETIARLSHPNIVMAFDAGEDDAGPYLVMEYVDGRDLASIVESDGPLSVAAAVNYILQAARGLEYAHSQGIIHRDIKPANLLRDAAGTIKLTDLGVARLSNAEGAATVSGITQTGGVLGSVHYMSVEQAIDSTRIDFRSDIYSLGATLYSLLTGEAPYNGNTMMAVLLKHRDAAIPSLPEVRKDIPVALDAVFRRMLAKSPDDRYQTMAEVVRVLEAIQTSLAGSVPPVPLTSPPGRNADTSCGGARDATQNTIAVRCGPLHAPATLKVLLVEPSRTQSAIIRKYLAGQGFEDVVAVPSGRGALELAQSNPPGVVVTAMHLPDMTGIELARQMRQGRVAGPGFVLISSEGETKETSSLSKCGTAIVLHKPFTAEGLAQALRFVCEHREASAAGDTLRGRLRVLIVDDSTPARLHVRQVLTDLGFSLITEAADGAQAVAAVARDSFDLIVTDYNMPLMDGGGLVAYLKQNPATKPVPIIMVTTETDPTKLQSVRQLGVTAICNKSFQGSEVSTILDELFPKP
jgi:serine/threonine protein kinase/DNA-binding response OmpR family regulator